MSEPPNIVDSGTDASLDNGTTMRGDEAELARMGYKQELKYVYDHAMKQSFTTN